MRPLCAADPHAPCCPAEEKHKGFGFVTFASSADAQDAIDNMDLNELRGKVLRVNLARPSKMPVQGLGNKASACLLYLCRLSAAQFRTQSGSRRNGSSSTRSPSRRAEVRPGLSTPCTAADRGLRAGAALRAHTTGNSPGPEGGSAANGDDEDATMEE